MVARDLLYGAVEVAAGVAAVAVGVVGVVGGAGVGGGGGGGGGVGGVVVGVATGQGTALAVLPLQVSRPPPMPWRTQPPCR
jgi:hypothetical protein